MGVTLSEALLLIAAVLPSIVLHEVAHGYVAYRCGDPTAKNAGRLTLNPLAHIDLFGTVLLPLLLVISGLPPVGYAKAVPVSVNRLRKPRNQSVYVALAGPLVNFVLVVVAWVLCTVLIHAGLNGYSNVLNFGLDLGIINILLGLFNMIPIPPLDGSAVLERMVPRRHLPRYFQVRQRALPFVLIALFVAIYFHWDSGVVNWLQLQFTRTLPQ
jgi:Zn-dependent protease